jgi:hypothetical protein
MNAVAKEYPVIELDKGQSVSAIPTPMSMLAVAVQNGMDVATIKDLMDLHERFERAESVKAYNEAFAAFKAEAVQVIKNKLVTDGPLKGKGYAELFSVVDAVTPALSKHGLSHSWKVTKDEKDWLEVTCILKHVRGHSESVSMGGPPDAGGAKSAIQARASTISYLQRYSLKAACGVAEKNDDNDGAGKADGMSEDDVAAWTKKIEATTTKEAAKEVWRDSVKACEALGDVAAGNALKAVLKRHGEFIDQAAK